MKSSSIVKPYMHYEKYKNKRFKEIEAQRRDVKLWAYTNIPQEITTLSLKEGRIFFLGGFTIDRTTNTFMEFFEESNTIFYHKPMNVKRQNHGAWFVSGRIYAIGGYNFGKDEWINSIESIALPERPLIDHQANDQNNYELVSIFEPMMENQRSNQEDSSPRCNWMIHESTLKFGRSNVAWATQIERYIYIFWGKYGKPDPIQPSLINEKWTDIIECFDTVNDTISEYTIKSWYKVDKCFSPGTVPIFSPRRRNPGILFFGGKFKYHNKKAIELLNKNYIMFPQDKDKCKQLSGKYGVNGCELLLSINTPDDQKKKRKKDKNVPKEINLYNGGIECIRNLNMFTEDFNYFYFLGWREKCKKLEHEDPYVEDDKDLLDKHFGKSPDPLIESNIDKTKNVQKVFERMYGVDKDHKDNKSQLYTVIILFSFVQD